MAKRRPDPSVFNLYARAYFAGQAAATRHGPVDKATLRKLQTLAAELAAAVGRTERAH